MLTLGDKGSTLEGVSWPTFGLILGVLALVLFVVICVVLPIWRQVHHANLERQWLESDPGPCDRGICAAGRGHQGTCAEASGWDEEWLGEDQ